MEDEQPKLETRLGFELKLKEGRSLPESFVLVVGLKAAGAVLAKSLEGIVLLADGDLMFKYGGPFAKVFVLKSKGMVVLAAESDIHYDQAVLAEELRASFLQQASRTIILESIPWAMARTWGHSAFDLGANEEDNCIAVYDKEETIPIKEALGAHIFSALKSKPATYYLLLSVENAANFTDSKQLEKEISTREGFTFVENKIRSSISSMLQGSSYI